MTKTFDRYEKNYEQLVERSIAFSSLKHDFFLEAKAIAQKRLFAEHFDGRPPQLLDLGCGIGRLHPLLEGMTAGIAGTDVSEASVERARQDNPDNDYRPMVGQGIPWPEASFYVSLAVCVFHHIPPAERAAAAAEMARVTRLGGLVPGWSSLMVVFLTISSIQLVSLAFIGEYVGRIFEQSKKRPLFVVRDVIVSGKAQVRRDM